MPVAMKKGMWSGRGTETQEEKPRPIRPKGASSRLPFLLFVAVLVGLFIGYRYLTESGLYKTAEAFVRQSAEIRSAIGEVRDCRLWFPFKVDFPDDVPRIDLTLAVEGEKGSTKVQVTLIRDREKWRVVSAAYEDRNGMLRPLPKAGRPIAPAGK
jgi:hypothetical protein